MKPQDVTHFHLFGGSGSGAAGYKDADPSIGAMKGRMVLLGGIDVDPLACADFKMLNGVAQACVDLFSVEQYLAWHGHMPPEGWREAIGNAVPRKSAKAIGTVMGQTILLARNGETFVLGSTPIWVRPMVAALAVAREGGAA